MKNLVHLFKYKDKYLALDIVSNSLIELDELAYEVMGQYIVCENDSLKLEGLKNNLIKKGYSVSDSELESIVQEIVQLKNDKTFFNKEIIPQGSLFGDETIIKAMCLHVAHDCNLRCRYCFAHSGHFGGKRMLLDVETGKKAIDFLIKSSKNRKHLEIDFFGGEPLMNMDVTKALITYAKEEASKYDKIINLTLTTNCMLLDEEYMDYLNQENISLVLSLDGDKNTNDNMRHTIDGSSSYDTIVPNIQATIKSRNNTGYVVRGTYTGEKLEFSDDVKHMRDLGFYYLSMEPVVAPEQVPYALTPKHLKKIEEEYEKLADDYLASLGTDREFNFFHFNVDLEDGPCLAKRLSGCGAGNHYIAVTPDGEIYPCHQFVDKKEFLLGHVDKGITNHDLIEKFKATNIYAKEDCKTCWARFMCAGGCHANAYDFNKNINQPYQLACEITKRRLETALYIEAVKASRD